MAAANVEDQRLTAPEEPRRRVPFLTVVDPAGDAAFDASTPSRKEIKQNIKHLEYVCSGCGEEKRADQMKACGRCKIARYCSTQCQKSDWKRHKLDCVVPSEGGDVGQYRDVTLKLAARVGANEALMDNILLHSVLQLGLLRDSSLAEKYVIRVTCGNSPADLQGYMNGLINGDGPPEDVQVLLTCQAIDRIPLEEAPPLVRRFEMEKRARYIQSGGRDPFVIIYFVNEEGDMGVSIHGRPVCEAMLAYMSTKPTMEIRSAMFGTSVVPLDEKAIIQQFNNMIRMDKSNKFKLRSYPMPKPTQDPVNASIEEASS
ncbi:unnamed protein product [Somion occarium]|uniref:MYND-type domain-containing protein n=1 Tax=Somion occarium TaxID=3059160 RepID=A0ABP1CG62_9APHY